MTVVVKHAKVDNKANWTQAQLDAQIVAGNFEAGTILADIVLPSDWNANHTITGLAAVATSGAYSDLTGTPTAGANTALSNLASVAINTSLLPGTDGASDLGSTTKEWANLFLASGGVINWGNGNIKLTQSTGHLAFNVGASQVLDLSSIGLAIGTTSHTDVQGNVALNVVGAANTSVMDISDGTATFGFFMNGPGAAPQVQMGSVSNHEFGFFTNNGSCDVVLLLTHEWAPRVDGGSALGTTSQGWANLFLASGGVINWNNGNYTLTHSSGKLTAAGGPFVASSFIPTSTTPPTNGMYLRTTNTLGFSANSSEVLDVSSIGLAIGTTSHTDVQGSVALNVVGAANTNILDISDGTATFGFYMNGPGGAPQVQMGSISNHQFGFFTNNASCDVVLNLTHEWAPRVDGGSALGTTSQGWANLFLASGGVINWNNGNVTLTQSSGTLTCSGNIGIGNATPSATFLQMGVGTTAKSQVNWGTTSVAPTSPNNGDMWFDGTNLKIRIGGATKTVTVS